MAFFFERITWKFYLFQHFSRTCCGEGIAYRGTEQPDQQEEEGLFVLAKVADVCCPPQTKTVVTGR